MHILDFVENEFFWTMIIASKHFKQHWSRAYELAIEFEEKQTVLHLEENPIALVEIS